MSLSRCVGICEYKMYRKLQVSGFSFIFPQVVSIIYYGRREISRHDIGSLAGPVPMSFVFAPMYHGPIICFIEPKCRIGILRRWVPDRPDSSPPYVADIDNCALIQGLLIAGRYCTPSVSSNLCRSQHRPSPYAPREEIGQGSSDLSDCTRSFVSTISPAVYTAAISNRLRVIVPPRVYVRRSNWFGLASKIV
jgi:hypothetical protein